MAFALWIIKVMPLIAEYVPSALGWVVGAAAEAVVGDKAKALLKDRAQRRAYISALRRAFVDFAKEFPSLASAFLDEHFLVMIMADEIALFLTRDETPDATRISHAYEMQFNKPLRTDVSPAVRRFLALVEGHLRKMKALDELLSHRQTDENNRILRGLQQRFAQPALPGLQGPELWGIGSDVHLDAKQVAKAFKLASQELLDWPQTLDGKNWLARPELGQLLERVCLAESSVSLLLGPPGSGKSALLGRLACEIAERQWAVLAIKADQLPEDLASLEGLQKHYELPGPVMDCIRALAKDGGVVLLVDQLDALSELIDLKTRRLTVLLRLINQVKLITNVHIVSSCRVFERTYDKRLNSIDAEEIHLALPSWEAVEPILGARGLIASAWPAAFREILRFPQCLKLFLRHFSGTGEARIFETYQAMLESLWSERLFAASEHGEASAFVHDIATEMAEQEVLFVPTAKFDHRRKALSYVVASGILQYDHTGRQITFTHQTLFDFARARAFIAKQQSLSRYVLERQTGLFVRPKLWSALHYLRAANCEAYRREVEAIWRTAGLRLHLKTLLIDFFGQQEEPLDFEIRLLRPAFSDQSYGPSAFAAVVGRKAWFDLISVDLLSEGMSGSTEISWATINVLQTAWAFAKPRVLELISTLWLSQPDRHNHVWYTLRGLQEWDRNTLAIAIEIVNQTAVANSSVLDLASIISVSAPTLAPELIGVQLQKQIAEAKEIGRLRAKIAEATAHGEAASALFTQRHEDPLRKIIEGNNDWYDISAIAEAAPAAFLAHVWPPIKEALEEIAGDDAPRKVEYHSDYLLATNLEVDQGNRLGAERPLVDSLVYAVRGIIKENGTGFQAFVQANQSSNSMTVHRLIAIGLCELAPRAPQFALDYLLQDKRRLALGNFHEDERETKMLLRALLPHLGQDDRKRLEEAILGVDRYQGLKAERDPKERHELQKFNRLFRLRLLLQFEPSHLSPQSCELVQSELRIFKNFRDERREVSVMFSKSPMSPETMGRANDTTIKKFLESFPDEMGWGDGFGARGGSIETSRAFATFAKQHPKRAVGVIAGLDPATHQRPAAYAIRDLDRGELPDDELFDLVLKLDRNGFIGEEFRDCASDALRKRLNQTDTGLPASIISLLQRWLEEYKVEVTTGQEQAQDNVSDRDERTDSLVWGLGSGYAVPAGSYEILNTLFWGLISRAPDPTNHLLSILEKHLSKSDRIEVWSALAHSALPNLRYCDREPAQAFLSHLFQAYPRLLARESGLLLVAHSIGWVSSDLSACWVTAVRDSGWVRAPQAYGELLALRSVLVKSDRWSIERIEELLASNDLVASESPGLVRGLVFGAANLWKDADDRTLLTRILSEGMNSSRKEIASAAIDWFRVTDDIRLTADSRPILEAFATGRSLETVEHRGYALDRVGDLVDDAPDLVYRVCRRIIDIYKTDVGDLSKGAALESETLLNVALTLQRQDEPHRTHGLELFELLLQHNAYKVRGVLMDIDRRPGASILATNPQRRRRQRRGGRRRE